MDQTITLPIDGMSCEHCVASVTEVLEGVSGVSRVHVDLDAGQATLTAAAHVTRDDLAQAVNEAGYEVPTAS